jgi:phage-related protein
MATPTFSWVVNTQATPDIAYTVRSAKMGDGFVQEIAEGINNRTESWDISWVGNDTDVMAIMDFFDALAGYKSFYWTSPLNQIGLYKCKNPKPQEMGGNTFQLTGTFTKAYAA